MQPIHILQKYWGFSSFRPLQEDIIHSVLQRKDNIALLPTGGGKSVCYQVPALMMEGLCLVISPLVALMQDQVSKLQAMDIPATLLFAGMHYKDVQRTLRNAVHGAYKLLYVSPEQLQSGTFRDHLPELPISFIAIDEAHCVSQWGHDFRPDYLKIAEVKQFFHHIPILALTASATAGTLDDIISQLRLRTPVVFRQSFKRENIFYSIRSTSDKNGDTIDALQRHPGSAIIYCRSRRQTQMLTKTLVEKGVKAANYHAGMPADKRTDTQDSWMVGDTSVIVATTAFGMGIDKPDVRLVIHYDAPEYPEAYYQEAGRAGRDGKQALALCLYNNSDLKRLRESTALRYPGEVYLRKVYQSVCEYLQLPIGVQPDKYFPFDLHEFAQRFQLKPVEASYASRILQQEGLWTLSEAVTRPATVEVLADRQQIDEVVTAYPTLGLVLTNILRLYSNVFHIATSIRIQALAKQTRMKQEELMHYLQQLHNMELIEFVPAKDGPQLFFHHQRADSRHLILDLQRIGQLRRSHEKRITAMVELMTAEICRERFLLNYFDEKVSEDCGHCDHCNSSQRASPYSEYSGRLLTMLSERSLSLPEVTASFSLSEKEGVLQELRQLMDANKITRDKHGNFLTN